MEERSKSPSADLVPEVVEPVAPATPDGTPPYRDPAPEELDLSGPDRSLKDARSGDSDEDRRG
jgi:hypothetical protein